MRPSVARLASAEGRLLGEVLLLQRLQGHRLRVLQPHASVPQPPQLRLCRRQLAPPRRRLRPRVWGLLMGWGFYSAPGRQRLPTRMWGGGTSQPGRGQDWLARIPSCRQQETPAGQYIPSAPLRWRFLQTPVLSVAIMGSAHYVTGPPFDAHASTSTLRNPSYFAFVEHVRIAGCALLPGFWQAKC